MRAQRDKSEFRIEVNVCITIKTYLHWRPASTER